MYKTKPSMNFLYDLPFFIFSKLVHINFFFFLESRKCNADVELLAPDLAPYNYNYLIDSIVLNFVMLMNLAWSCASCIV